MICSSKRHCFQAVFLGLKMPQMKNKQNCSEKIKSDCSVPKYWAVTAMYDWVAQKPCLQTSANRSVNLERIRRKENIPSQRKSRTVKCVKYVSLLRFPTSQIFLRKKKFRITEENPARGRFSFLQQKHFKFSYQDTQLAMQLLQIGIFCLTQIDIFCLTLEKGENASKRHNSSFRISTQLWNPGL